MAMMQTDGEDIEKGKRTKRCTKSQGNYGQVSQTINLEILSQREQSSQGTDPPTLPYPL